MRKYGFLNDTIIKEFKTLGIFSRTSGIPKATLSMLINGRYGWDETNVIKRVNNELKRLRPDLDLSHILDTSYAWHQKFLLEKSVVKNGFRITVDVRMDGDGKLTIAPGVEGY